MATQAVVETARETSRAQGADALPAGAAAPVAVVGGGPCGVRAAQELSSRGLDAVLFNAEPWEPYNRVKLTPLLAGDVQLKDIALPRDFAGPGTVRTHTGLRVARVDCAAARLETADGRVWPYSALVLATGSRPFVPKIPGRERSGVFTFRDADDASALFARSFSARRLVVIGGGLLGLEAARGMLARGLRVSVVEHEDRLMPRQLDAEAGALLKARIEALGVAVRCGARVAEIEGADRVSGVALATGERIACDTVVICTGVRANVALAAEAGLAVGRGVQVDDAMRSSDPRVFAVGECAEHRGEVHGLVGPGLEQAEIAAGEIAASLGRGDAAAGGGGGRVYGAPPAAKLKVIGAEVLSIGRIEALEVRPNVVSRAWRDGRRYRRVFVERGRLVGAVGVGDWPEAGRLQSAVAARARALPWMLRRFGAEGALWRAQSAGASLAASAIACNCTGVTCGRIRDSLQLGATSLEEVRRSTGASTVCGSCAGLVEELISGGAAAPKPAPMWRWLLGLSALGAVGAAATLAAPPVRLPDAYGAAPLLEALWFDNLWKQWSGYTLLALSLLAALLGVRKRVGVFRRLGGYDGWRITHLAIGAACAVALFAHTGFRFGDNLTMALMAAFVATLGFGAAAGLATGGEHKLRESGVGSAERPPRAAPLWLHVLALWPLPALLLAHILSVYVY